MLFISYFLEGFDDNQSDLNNDHDSDNENDNDNDNDNNQDNDSNQDNDNSPEDSESDDNEALYEQIKEAQELTLQRIKDNCSEQSVKKSAKSYLKNLMTGYKGNLQAFSNNLFSLGQEAAAPQKNGKKRKNTFLIPVQKTAKSRRLHKHRGNGPSTAGRKVQDHPQTSHLDINDEDAEADGDDGIVYHALPKQKHQKQKPKHSLATSVSLNKPNPKKH